MKELCWIYKYTAYCICYWILGRL